MFCIRISLKFPMVKLLDYQKGVAELEQHPNPFAVVVLAHLYTQKTRGQPEERYALKWHLTRMLYERGYTKRDVWLLFRFIDWVMQLPPMLKERFRTQMITYEEERKMTYVTETIRLFKEESFKEGIEQGVQQKAREAVVEVLDLRFGDPHPAITERIYTVEDPAILKALHRQAVLAESLERFQRVMDDLLSQTPPRDD